MTWETWAFLGGLCLAISILWRRVGVNLSLTSVLIGLLMLLHGPAYLYYTRSWGPETNFYEVILSAAGGQDILPTLDLALGMTFLFVCLGVIVVDRLKGVSATKWRHALEHWARTPARSNPGDARRVTLVSTILAVCILLPFVFIDDQLPKVLNFLTADLSEFEKIALRREGGGSNFYLYNLLLSTLLPFVGFRLLALVFARTPGIKAWAIIFIGLVAVGKAATLSKAPLAVFALQCALVWLMLRKLTLSWRVVTVLVGLATFLFVLMAWVANPNFDDLLSTFDFLFYRVFMIVNEGLLEYFAAIPYVIPHSWGTQFSWIATMFQMEEPRLPTFWLVGEVHRGVLGSTTTVMFMGDAWADFAWSGVAFIAFLAGAVTRWIDIQLIVKRGKTMATVAGLALGHFGIFIMMSTSFQTSLLTGGLLFVAPFVRLVSMRWRAHPPVSPIDTEVSARPTGIVQSS